MRRVLRRACRLSAPHSSIRDGVASACVRLEEPAAPTDEGGNCLSLWFVELVAPAFEYRQHEPRAVAPSVPGGRLRAAIIEPSLACCAPHPVSLQLPFPARAGVGWSIRDSMLGVVDTKQTKTTGEHHVASELARRGWAPVLTRDGLERTDILAVLTEPENRRLVEIQVKTARGPAWKTISWPLGAKSQSASKHGREYFVMVAVPHDLAVPPRSFILPRSHVAAAAWIEHMNWLTEPGIAAGKRNAPVERSRVFLSTFAGYEDRWDLLLVEESEAPVLLPRHYRELAQEPRVSLPDDHPWRSRLPEW